MDPSAHSRIFDGFMLWQVLNNYDLVMITERLDESLVVLKHMLNLNFADISYLPMKVAAAPNAKNRTRTYLRQLRATEEGKSQKRTLSQRLSNK